MAVPTSIRPQLQTLPSTVREPLVAAIADGMHVVFLWAAPFALAAFLLGWAIKAVPLRGSLPVPASSVPASSVPASAQPGTQEKPDQEVPDQGGPDEDDRRRLRSAAADD